MGIYVDNGYDCNICNVYNLFLGFKYLVIFFNFRKMEVDYIFIFFFEFW